MKRRDYQTAHTCFQQHLQLIQTLVDYEAEIKAYIKISELYKLQDNFEDAIEQLVRAQDIAEREGHLNELRRINCLIGYYNGLNGFSSYLSKISSVANALADPTTNINNANKN